MVRTLLHARICYLLSASFSLLDSSCYREIDCQFGCDPLAIRLDPNQVIDPRNGGCIYGILEKYASYAPLQVTLSVEDASSGSSPITAKVDSANIWLFAEPNRSNPFPACSAGTLSAKPDQNISSFVVNAQMPLPAAFAAAKPFSKVKLTYLEMEESGPLGIRREATDSSLELINSPLANTAALSTSAVSSSVERLGFAGGRLLSLRSYVELSSPKKRFAQYAVAASALTQDPAPQGYIFTKEFFDALPTADFAQDRVVWLDVVPAKGFALVNCPVAATSGAECASPSSMGYPNSLLPLDLKAFAISPKGDYAVIAQADGTLRWAELPAQPANPPPLAWADVTGQPGVTLKEGVLLSLADLNGDGAADLVAVQQSGPQPGVSVFLASGGGGQYTYDAGVSSSWQSAVGSVAPIGAVALGDLDGDGRAEVAISRGSQVEVWLNQGSMSAKRVWTMAVGSQGVPVRAMGIGQVDGARGNDLVVASSAAPDAMGNATQYLHVFLGQ